jgi:hypothetical protein
LQLGIKTGKGLKSNRRDDGAISATDWGICQINDRFHIGPNMDFPSVEWGRVGAKGASLRRPSSPIDTSRARRPVVVSPVVA